MRTLARWIPLSMLLLAPLTAGAQEQAAPEGAPPAAPAPAPVEAAPAPAVIAAAPPAAAPAAPPVAFTWEALADMYYLYNFTGNPSTQGPGGRAFDTTANNFALNYAKLGVGVDTESVAFRLDLGAGHTAAIINSISNGYPAVKGQSTDATKPAALDRLSSSDFLIQQAFGTWKITKDITLDAGRFVTTAGAEVIESNKNWLYSRSFLFNGIPFLHNGIRLNAAITPALKLQLGLVNGWNWDVDNNRGKTGEVSVTFTPPDSDNTSVIVTSYFGKEDNVSGGPTWVLVDGVFGRDFGKASLSLNIDYVKKGDPYWLGAALMARYFFTDSFNLAVRGEYITSKKAGYIDPDPSPLATDHDLTAYEGTFMAGYIVSKHFELRAEVRGDFADKKVFFKGTDARKNQMTGTIAALTYF